MHLLSCLRTAIITVTVDCIRGRYEFDSVKVVHDFGRSMNTIVTADKLKEELCRVSVGWHGRINLQQWWKILSMLYQLIKFRYYYVQKKFNLCFRNGREWTPFLTPKLWANLHWCMHRAYFASAMQWKHLTGSTIPFNAPWLWKFWWCFIKNRKFQKGLIWQLPTANCRLIYG